MNKNVLGGFKLVLIVKESQTSTTGNVKSPPAMNDTHSSCGPSPKSNGTPVLTRDSPIVSNTRKTRINWRSGGIHIKNHNKINNAKLI